DFYVARVRDLVREIPDIIKACPNAMEECITVDNSPTVEELARIYTRMIHQIRRSNARATFRVKGNTSPKALVRQANQVYKNGKVALQSIPRFETKCG